MISKVFKRNVTPFHSKLMMNLPGYPQASGRGAAENACLCDFRGKEWGLKVCGVGNARHVKFIRLDHLELRQQQARHHEETRER